MKPACIEEKDFRYSLPSEEWIIGYKRKIEDFLAVSKTKADLDDFEVEINYLMLCNIFIRVDERDDYYLYFHSKEEIMHMSCDKEIALLAFWIVKYKPFRIKTITQEEQFYQEFKCTINELIAALLVVFYICDKIPSLKTYFDEKKINTFIYDLTNRDISKEAMIMYVESFIPSPKMDSGKGAK